MDDPLASYSYQCTTYKNKRSKEGFELKKEDAEPVYLNLTVRF